MPNTIPCGARSIPYSEFSCEPVSVLLARLEPESVRSVWLVGGVAALEDFVAQRKSDRIDLFTVLVLLGEGQGLFPEGIAADWRLGALESFSSGVVHSTCFRSPGFPAIGAGG